jgi:hypothetical protein
MIRSISGVLCFTPPRARIERAHRTLPRGGGAPHVTLDTNVIETQQASEEEIMCINGLLDTAGKRSLGP